MNVLPQLKWVYVTNHDTRRKWKISDKTLIETFDVLQITNDQFDYFFISIKVKFFCTLNKGLD